LRRLIAELDAEHRAHRREAIDDIRTALRFLDDAEDTLATAAVHALTRAVDVLAREARTVTDAVAELVSVESERTVVRSVLGTVLRLADAGECDAARMAVVYADELLMPAPT